MKQADPATQSSSLTLTPYPGHRTDTSARVARAARPLARASTRTRLPINPNLSGEQDTKRLPAASPSRQHERAYSYRRSNGSGHRTALSQSPAEACSLPTKKDLAGKPHRTPRPHTTAGRNTHYQTRHMPKTKIWLAFFGVFLFV